VVRQNQHQKRIKKSSVSNTGSEQEDDRDEVLDIETNPARHREVGLKSRLLWLAGAVAQYGREVDVAGVKPDAEISKAIAAVITAWNALASKLTVAAVVTSERQEPPPARRLRESAIIDPEDTTSACGVPAGRGADQRLVTMWEKANPGLQRGAYRCSPPFPASDKGWRRRSSRRRSLARAGEPFVRSAAMSWRMAAARLGCRKWVIRVLPVPPRRRCSAGARWRL
jgi:hypothetical protein